MRSFPLFTLLLIMFALQTVQAAEKLASGSDFFTVVLPYDVAQGQSVAISSNAAIMASTKSQDNHSKKALNDAIRHGMALLLVRVTGQKTFLSTLVAKSYLKNPRAWLRAYDITPRMEDGVQVGQNIVLQFSEQKLNAEFSQRRVSIWPISLRPKTLVMGSLVQQGEVIRLDQETMRYRLDVEFRDYPQQMALPIRLPGSTSNWVRPAVPTQTVSQIQSLLASTNQDYLLSFKLLDSGNSNNLLSWYLYSRTGSLVTQGQQEGPDRQALMQTMFDQTMQRYVTIANQESMDVKQLTLNIYQLTDADQVMAFNALLNSQEGMIISAQLASVEANQIQFTVAYQGEYQAVVDWIRAWPQTFFVGEAPQLYQVDVKFNPDYDPQESTEMAAPEVIPLGAQ